MSPPDILLVDVFPLSMGGLGSLIGGRSGGTINLSKPERPARMSGGHRKNIAIDDVEWIGTDGKTGWMGERWGDSKRI